MNLYQKRLMDKPSIESEYCAFCYRPATEQHHIVKRSQGGTNGPTVSVCGWGNTSGCHGLLEQKRLHLDWDEERGWVYKITREPKKDVWLATDSEGWSEVKTYDQYSTRYVKEAIDEWAGKTTSGENRPINDQR